MIQGPGSGDQVDNNNKQQPKEGFEEGFEEESEEGSKEISEESSEDSSEEDQGLTVEESSRATRKKLTPPLPKPDLKPVSKAPSPDPNLDFELEDNVKQALITILKEVKITRLNLFYKDKKKA
ncbi:hypothetical protein B7463_g8126, partial [Scytalidium lignicola]